MPGQATTGPIVLASATVGALAIPVLAVLVDDTDLGVFIVTAMVFGPLAILLARSGSGDDQRQLSAGFARRAGAVAIWGCVFVLVAMVAAVAGNSGWIPCFWIAVFLFALARSWGLVLRPLNTKPID